MWIYSDSRNDYTSFSPKLEYEVLNEMNSVSPRKDSNCKKFTRFLFEFDDMKLDAQTEIMVANQDLLVRATFSGSKSIHMIVEFEDKYNEFCKKWYKYIWRWLERNVFPGADPKCSNPSRLTRCPSVVRHDTGLVQKLMFSSDNYISKNEELMAKMEDASKKWGRNEIEMRLEASRKVFFANFARKFNHDGMCRDYKNVKRYLETPFPKVRGNGNSASWFYAALCTCIEYNDNKTLQEVKDKAKREKWTQHEIDHTEQNARDAVSKLTKK